MLSICSRRGTTPVLAVLRDMALNPEVPRPLLLTPHTLPPAPAAGLARTAAFAPTWHCIAGNTACAIPEPTGCPPFLPTRRPSAKQIDALHNQPRNHAGKRNAAEKPPPGIAAPPELTCDERGRDDAMRETGEEGEGRVARRLGIMGASRINIWDPVAFAEGVGLRGLWVDERFLALDEHRRRRQQQAVARRHTTPDEASITRTRTSG